MEKFMSLGIGGVIFGVIEMIPQITPEITQTQGITGLFAFGMFVALHLCYKMHTDQLRELREEKRELLGQKREDQERIRTLERQVADLTSRHTKNSPTQQ